MPPLTSTAKECASPLSLRFFSCPADLWAPTVLPNADADALNPSVPSSGAHVGHAVAHGLVHSCSFSNCFFKRRKLVTRGSPVACRMAVLCALRTAEPSPLRRWVASLVHQLMLTQKRGQT